MLLLFSSLFLHLVFAVSQESIILKNADNMIRDTTTNTLQLSGNVQVIYQQQYLSCEKAIVYLETKTIEAIGAVVLSSPTIYAEADKMFLNYENNTGVIYNGYVQSGTVSFEGELIYKTGENEYEAVNSTYSACTTCPPAWSFTGSEIRATFGGYARIKNTILRLADIPVFWFPYMLVPLKNERQSGILTPSHSRSTKGGNTFSLPIFWAIDESQDATFTLTTYEFRGPKFNLEYRYVFAPGSAGNLRYGTLRDEAFDESDRITATYGDNFRARDRWFLSYQHLYSLPNYFEHRTNLNLTSDLEYSADFEDEFDFYREPAIVNRMSLSKYHENYHGSLDAILYTNQLKTDPLADNEDAVHKMPEINWSLKTQRISNTNFYYNIDANYVNYARNYYSYDDTNNDGDFDKGVDYVRTGQRLIFRPEVLLPFSLGPYVDVLPSIAYQENLYRFSDETDLNPYGRYLQTSLSLRSRLQRVFGGGGGPETTAYKHEITPFLTYTKTPFIQKSSDSFIGPKDIPAYSSDQSITDDDLANNLLQFDFRDRLPLRDFIEFGLRQSLYRRRYEGGRPVIKELVSWNLSQQYDLKEAERDDSNAEPWSSITSELRFYFDRFEASQNLDYYPYQNHVNSSSRLRFYPNPSHFFELTYNQNFQVRKGEKIDSKQETKDIIALGVFRFKNINLGGSAEYSAFTHDLEKYKFIVQLKPPGDCWNFTVSQTFNDNDKTISFKFEFLFDGSNDDRFNPVL